MELLIYGKSNCLFQAWWFSPLHPRCTIEYQYSCQYSYEYLSTCPRVRVQVRVLLLWNLRVRVKYAYQKFSTRVLRVRVLSTSTPALLKDMGKRNICINKAHIIKSQNQTVCIFHRIYCSFHTYHFNHVSPGLFYSTSGIAGILTRILHFHPERKNICNQIWTQILNKMNYYIQDISMSVGSRKVISGERWSYDSIVLKENTPSRVVRGGRSMAVYLCQKRDIYAAA